MQAGYKKKSKLKESAEVLTLVNSGDKAEVSGAALLGLPEVGILVGVCVDNAAVGKNNLPVLDCVASEAVRVGVEGIPEGC